MFTFSFLYHFYFFLKVIDTIFVYLQFYAPITNLAPHLPTGRQKFLSLITQIKQTTQPLSSISAGNLWPLNAGFPRAGGRVVA